jgi:hypothetical protein
VVIGNAKVWIVIASSALELGEMYFAFLYHSYCSLCQEQTSPKRSTSFVSTYLLLLISPRRILLALPILKSHRALVAITRGSRLCSLKL